MVMPIHPNNIGGATVVRTFTMGDKVMRSGMTLTGDEVRAMRQMNRTSLVDRGYLYIWPKDHDDRSGQEAEGSVRFPVNRGFGRYDVIQGRKLNTEPLTREEAHKLAGVPLPEGDGKATKEH